MIKRRFYKNDHGDGDNASDSSSSSSDSELDAEAAEETETEDDDVVVVREYHKASSSSSGYASEDSSANEVNVDSSGLPTNDEEIEAGNVGQPAIKRHSSRKSDAEIVDPLSNTVAEKDSSPSDVGYILKCKSVFKCRLCPRIVCLTEETLMTHLKSKRHARSEKLLSEGRLKLMLNSDGEIEEGEEEGETHAERHARIVAAAQNLTNSTKKNKGRQRQRKRLKKKTGNDSSLDIARKSTKSPAKKKA
ncbi:hypothetical protein RHMOL_Rhmol05G0104200 [Rhododendron molle]|uniref:Uncharacterized protein n=6 Tax=Rhododendron molle TaxID=49168 RepID=A0ACC0NMN6_RHOML|nr:hypothetical protein RHMOL_Rhmol05G0104200 [Rhododendron molle]KAI8554501.1 hypothetical protein RHMOL_Rhmol05G0104200 [Rhododendron molle]KAI8554502.1 hypothetical protein RHMOL_Rhmol05G0104200 [Rhododendron molle]KAI8554503.1 hypothetical protein RHMOL_Rhmol05G0104200 [Rhododendron molle]KAI8554505.1 hypothetical protein RHMOL_Rhmol05G0104200 [Rhododendron molle]